MSGVVQTLAARWATHGAKLVVGDQTLDAPQLLDRVRRAIGWLEAQGVGHGDRVLIGAEREIAFLEVHLAALAIGASTVPVHPRATDYELDHLLLDAAPKVVVLPRPRTQDQHDWADLRAALDAAAPASIPGLDDHRSGPVPADEAILCYTSGTTGRPKGARIPHRAVLAQAAALAQAWGVTHDDVLLHALPFFHVHGLIVAQHTALFAGATTVWVDKFDAAETLAALHTHQVTLFMGVPTFYTRWLALDELALPSSLRLCTCGSAPLPSTVHETFQARTGHAVLERYGMTEAGIVISNPLDGARVPGSIGQPLPGVTVRVVDPDTGLDAAPGEIGELWLQAPTTFLGYLNRPDATAAMLAHGWLHTNDLGRRDEDGRLWLVGRRDDTLLVGGFNVYPAEIEAALREHPWVSDVAVVGLPDKDLGTRVVATVVPHGAPSADALLGFLRERLAPYKLPRALAFAPELPRNAMGKVQKRDVAAAWTTITVRPAIFDEADRCAAWNIAMALETEGVTLDADLALAGARGVFDRDGVDYFIATVAGLPVGQVMVTREWSDWRCADVWWLQSVYVMPAWRGRGVYAAMHGAVRARAAEAGAAGLRLYVDHRNTRAQAVYRAVGMNGEHYATFEEMFGGPA
jgi:malonyl-CoA/methylmalonyl-CoA synthetase